VINKEELWEQVYKVARQSASRCARIHRNLVSSDDVYQHLNLWAVEHWHKIEEWEGQESLVFKLKRTFHNEAQKFAAKERAYKSKSKPKTEIKELNLTPKEVEPEIINEIVRIPANRKKKVIKRTIEIEESETDEEIQEEIVKIPKIKKEIKISRDEMKNKLYEINKQRLHNELFS
jgi:hypothetical protein